MTLGSLFSGCGGLDLGLERAGFAVAWQVELDKNCQRVLRRHWPHVDRRSDIRETDGKTLAPVDLIAGGSPCQDLSVAGGREGLAGGRSGLFFDFVRIADAQPAAWILWENVDGVLSAKRGADFGVILRELSGFWPAVPADGWRSAGVCIGPKRWCVWRVLDAQYFGVAQRRRRLFLVGGPRDGACAPQVLLESGCLPGNRPARGSERADSAGFAIKGAAIGRRPESGPQYGEILSDGSMYTLNCTEIHAVAYHLAQVTSGDNRANPQPGDPAPTLNGDPRLAVAYQCHGSNVGPAGTLRQGNGHVTGGVPFIAADRQTTRGVRRLTPVECERLMNYPDHWTRWGDDGRELSDSARYRMVGNGVASPVAEWIGRRLRIAMQPGGKANDRH